MFNWYSPGSTTIPGLGTFRSLTNGLAGFVLVAILLGFLIAAGSWALGSGIGNPDLAERGKHGVVLAFVAALLVGGAAVLLNFFFGLGQAAR